MAVPKRKTSKAKIGARRSHDYLGKATVIICPNCNEYTIPHRMCPSCGWYNKGVIKPPKIRSKKTTSDDQRESS